jgi:hypothetical protein
MAEQGNENEILHQLEKDKCRRDFCIDSFKKNENKKIRYHAYSQTAFSLILQTVSRILQSGLT